MTSFSTFSLNFCRIPRFIVSSSSSMSWRSVPGTLLLSVSRAAVSNGAGPSSSYTPLNEFLTLESACTAPYVSALGSAINNSYRTMNFLS